MLAFAPPDILAATSPLAAPRAQIRLMSLGNAIRRNTLWQFTGNTGTQVLTFVFGIILARLLAPEDFGMLVTIQVFTGMAGFVAGGGMGQALVRAKEATQQDYDCVFTLQLALGSLIYLAFFVAAPHFAQWYEQPLYGTLLRVSALSFLMRPFVNMPSSLLQRAMRFKAQSIIRVATLLVSSLVSISMAYAGYGVWSLVIGGLTGSVSNVIMLTATARWRPGLSTNFRRAKDLARYGMLVSANDIVTYVRMQATNVILSRTAGAASVGLFNKADSLAQMPRQLITSSLYPVLFRAMSQEQDNLDTCRYLFFRSLSLALVYASPFFFGLFWLAEPIIVLLYGEKWAASAAPMAILALAGPMLTIENLSGAVLAARAWLRKELVIQLIVLALTVAAVYFGLEHGLTGVATALVCVAAYNAFHMFHLARLSLKSSVSPLFVAIRPAVILNLILNAVLFVTDATFDVSSRHSFVYLVTMIGAGAVSYACAFLLLPLHGLESEQTRWKTLLRLNPAKSP